MTKRSKTDRFEHFVVITWRGKLPPQSVIKKLKTYGTVSIMSEIVNSSPIPSPVLGTDLFVLHRDRHGQRFSNPVLWTRLEEKVKLFHYIPQHDNSDIYIRVVGEYVYCLVQSNELDGHFFVLPIKTFKALLKEGVYVRPRIMSLLNPGVSKKIKFTLKPFVVPLDKGFELMGWNGENPNGDTNG